MPRPVDRKRRQDLMTRAWEFIRTRGVHRVSMRELADALGIKRPTLYFYFSDTSSIVEAVIADVLARRQAFLIAELSGRHHPVDFLYTLAATAQRFAAASEADAAALTFFLASVAQAPAASDERAKDPLVEMVEKFEPPLRQLAIKTLKDGVKKGMVAECNAAAIVGLVMTAIDGGLVQQAARGEDPAVALDQLWLSVLAPLRFPAADPNARPGGHGPVTAARPRPTA